jgi:hypothetical protein
MATPPTGRTASRSERRHQQQRRRRRRVVVAAIVVGVLVLGGIGAAVVLSGDDDEPSASSGNRSPSSTAATTTPPASDGSTATTAAPDTSPTTLKPGGPCEAGDVTAAVAASRPSQDASVSSIAFTNTARRSCTILGSPAVQLQGPGGAALPTQSVAGGGAVPALPADTVTIEPGGTGSFLVGYDIRTDPCLDVRSIALTLPGDNKTVPVEASLTVCANGVVNVSPVQPGTINP